MSRPIHEIARDIRNDWPKVNYAAVPYLEAMADLDKITGLLGMFLQNCKEEYNDRLKLNKLLFYSDFYNYKRTGTSITGITYRAIKYGPVPTYYDSIFALLEGNYSLISDFINDGRGGAREIFKSEIIPNEELFTEEELTTINKIMSTNLITIDESETLNQAIQKMEESRTHHLIITLERGNVIGIISSYDIVRERSFEIKAYSRTRR